MAEKKEHILSRYKKLFFHPKKFMDSITSERNYQGAMFFYIKLMIISVILTLIFSILINLSLSTFSITNLASSIISAIFSVGIAFAIPFIIAGIVHLGVLIFKGRQGYFSTYKPITYSMAISLIYGMLSTVIFGIITLIAPKYSPTIADITTLSTLTTNSGFVLVLAVYLTIILISLIHSLYAGIIGISKFQKISKFKTLGAMVIPFIIIIAIIIAIIIFLAPSLAGSA